MKNIITFLILLSTFTVYSQQISLNSQYMFNPSSFNCSAIGLDENYTQVQLNARKQWAGFSGAPSTQYITANSYLRDRFSMGGTLHNDVSGPSRRTGLTVVGAYKLPLSKDGRHSLSMGLGVSMTQHTIDISKLTTFLPDDPALNNVNNNQSITNSNNSYNNQFVPDAEVGFYYTYDDKAFAGISAKNLFQSDEDAFDASGSLPNRLVRNYFVYGGYNFEVSNYWKITPSLMYRMIDALAYQVEISTIITYNNQFWFGFSYRHEDAAVALIGIQYKEFRIGYSYDYLLSDISNYSTGSNELFLELQLHRGSKKKKKKNKTKKFKR